MLDVSPAKTTEKLLERFEFDVSQETRTWMVGELGRGG